MLDPALDKGADVLLYPLHPDLSPDIAGLDQLLQAPSKPVKALLATHFFGLAQDLSELRSWCDARSIILIEDCSHVLFTESAQSRGTGIFGKFVTASPYKFFPGDDGGLLYAPEARYLADVTTTSPNLVDELRGIKHLVEKSLSGRGVPLDISQLDKRLASLISQPLAVAEERRIPYTQPSKQFSRQESERSSLFSSRWLARGTTTDDIVRKRRANFQRWLEAVAELPSCQAVFGELPTDCTPYMFPLRIEHPTPHFYLLKHLGFPIWRWDEIAASDCPVAQDYRLHLLHLPCHQLLSNAQLDWMITALQKVIRIPSGGKL
jgi:dTDP-4-amino-4,6-dideoxygalactose transaminase